VNPDLILPSLILVFVVWRGATILRIRRQLPGLLAGGAQILDVRSAAEFAGGHVPGSVNIPLNELSARHGELDPARAVVACCASGARSAMACKILKSGPFPRVFNAGSWRAIPVR
jgi:rhodanese-related sulfurtransferase